VVFSAAVAALTVTACSADAPTGTPIPNVPLDAPLSAIVLPLPRYTIEALPLPPGYSRGEATAINESGDIVGWGKDAGGRDRALKWVQGAVYAMILPSGYTSSRANDINNIGAAVGWMRAPGGKRQPTRFVIRGLPIAITPPNYAEGEALGMNGYGDVVGEVSAADGTPRPARWLVNGPTTVYTDMAAATLADINDSRDAVGTDIGGWGHAAPFVRKANDQLIMLELKTLFVGRDIANDGTIAVGTPFGAWWSAPPYAASVGLGPGSIIEISDKGRFVGLTSTTPKQAITYRNATANLATLPNLHGGASASALGVNSCGTIVGVAEDAQGQSRPVRWIRSICDQ
jgi:uncharacterized membrane protein